MHRYREILGCMNWGLTIERGWTSVQRDGATAMQYHTDASPTFKQTVQMWNNVRSEKVEKSDMPGGAKNVMGGTPALP